MHRNRPHCFSLLFLPAALLFLFAGTGTAEETPEEIMKGVLSSFHLPLRDLLRQEKPDGWQDLFNGFSGNVGISYPLKKKRLQESEGSGTQGDRKSRDVVLKAVIRYNPITYWYFQTTFYEYMKEEAQTPWDPDFTYSFGYDDWHPYTFSLVYSNYEGNRLNPDRDKGEKFTRFEEGLIDLGWKFTVPRFIEELFIVHPAGGIRGSVHYVVTPRYYDNKTGTTEKWKQRLNLKLKYTIYKWLYINMDFFYYPDPGQQQPWDPDFTYGFGFFDWHPGTLSLQFNNFSGNSAGGNFFDNFKDGSLTASWSWAW